MESSYIKNIWLSVKQSSKISLKKQLWQCSTISPIPILAHWVESGKPRRSGNCYSPTILCEFQKVTVFPLPLVECRYRDHYTISLTTAIFKIQIQILSNLSIWYLCHGYVNFPCGASVSNVFSSNKALSAHTNLSNFSYPTFILLKVSLTKHFS